jgi:hypothetical protein
MQGPGAERFVVANLRLLAASFAIVGILFIAVPNGVLDVISDVGEWFGNDTRAPHGDRQLCSPAASAGRPTPVDSARQGSQPLSNGP